MMLKMIMMTIDTLFNYVIFSIILHRKHKYHAWYYYFFKILFGNYIKLSDEFNQLLCLNVCYRGK